MPIYPYVCTACGHEFDALQKISDDPLTECPECGEATLRKRLAAPAFQLKGTGWYETDFKHGSKGKQADGNDKSSGGGKSSGGSEGKDPGSKPAEGTKSGAKGESSGGGSKPATAAGGKDD
ncbi:MAG: FmdB family zinc ribbon protein [Gammaproteobacteria bacterium]|nr:FmdB family zinc ribbon protein [Gammaproteobacteria bacterium]